MNSRFGYLIRLIKGQVNKALTILLLSSFSFAFFAHAKTGFKVGKVYHFSIPSQPLSQSLNNLSDTARISFLFPYELVQSKRGNPVKGYYTVQQALDLLLQNSNLEGELSNNKAFLIKPKKANNKNFEVNHMNTQKTLLSSIFSALFGSSTDNKKVKKAIVGSALAASLPLSHAALAEQEAKEQAIEKIEIRGVRGSINRSLSEKKMNVGIVDSISAEDLGKFPDTNISESLQRIPGVTLEREFGVGATVNVRGLGPQFSLVQINGVSSTSSGFSGQLDEEGGREFDFSLLASELFSRVTISKTASAAQTEGGLAGVVSLYTPRPFSYSADEVKFSTSLQASRGNQSEDTTPRASVFFSKNFDDKWGVSASLSKSEITTTVNESGTWKYANLGTNIGFNATPGDVFSAPNYGHTYIPDDPRYLRNDINRDSLGATLTLQFNASDNLQFTLDNIYVSSDSLREYNRIDATLEWDIGGEPTGVQTETINGIEYITSASFPRVRNRVGTQNIDREETFSSHVLSAEWTPSDNLLITPLIGYTKRTGDEETYLYSFYNRIATDVKRAIPGYEFYPTGGTPQYYAQQSSAEDFLFNVAFSKDRFNTDEELVAKLDFKHFIDSDTLVSIDYGLMSSEREKSRDYKFWIMGQNAVQHLNPEHYAANQSAWDEFWARDDANQDNLLAGAGLTLAQVLGNNRSFSIDGINAPSSLIYADHAAMQQLYYQGLHGADAPNNNLRANDSAAGTYSITEETLAAYVQANFETDNSNFNFGLRVVSTDVESTGFLLSSGEIDPINPKSSYTEFLPSFNLTYDLEDEVKLKTAYARTMTRPPLSSLAPSTSIDSSRLEGRKGNTALLPYTANNLDLGIEWYFADESLLATSVFYKRIDSLVEDTIETETATFRQQISNELTTAPVDFVKPINGTDASVKGIEVSFQSPLSFLSESLSNFGTIINFTYTDSSASFESESDVRSSSLPGLSKNSYNFVTYYDDGTIDARLSYAWRSSYVDFFPESKYQDDFGQLDFSSNYNITENLSVQFEVLNLLDEQVIKYRDDNPRLPISVEQLERRIMVGVRYSL